MASISNDTDCKDLEASQGGAITKTDYVITLSDAWWFGVACVGIPTMVVADAVECACDGKDLSHVIYNARTITTLRDQYALFGAAGAVAGLIVGAGVGDVALLPLFIGGAAFAIPYIAFNGLVLVCAATEIGPKAFRCVAEKLTNSRPYLALTAGTRARERFKQLGNTPLYRGQRREPK